ncbi:hypothetical protein Pan97_07570 [Bremerella volcania]|uniref:Uncharacterized protein n=1 Tax=Bremerella volcania TaxID=2527984 RepID=A0A518C3F8_9BACT|nr:hypothetical protein [Bremerella volcania]QDU73758.1 hypothetical protein Pan97_07570 [Bremerella volcania]
MAKKTTNARKTTTDKAATSGEQSKSDLIRAWFKENPKGTATQCQRAMKEKHNIEVVSSHCQQVKNEAKQTVDLDTIKTAAEFVKTHGNVEDALVAIDQVGDFITQCGNAKKAKAALEAYQAMAAVIG